MPVTGPACEGAGHRTTRRWGPLRHDGTVEVLASRVLLRPSDPTASRSFYRDVLGLAVYREFGPRDDPGVVFFLGTGLLEVSGRSATGAALGQQLWLQVLYLSSGRWMFEQPHEWVPLLILTLVPAGRTWGLDALFASRGIAGLRGFPF